MKLKKNVAVSENGFVFNAERGESFTVNPIGVTILQAMQGGETTEMIVLKIVERFETDLATCEKDVYDFISMLHRSNLIEA